MVSIPEPLTDQDSARANCMGGFDQVGRRMNWDAARHAAREQSLSVSGPEGIRPRASEKDDGWLLRYAQFDSTCGLCGEEVIRAERVYMRKKGGRWEIAHEACR